MSASTGGLQHYRRLFGRDQGAINRDTLPCPIRYLRDNGHLVGRPRGEWASIRCPVHKGGDERRPSMGVSLIDGHFKCFTCGAKGGDIIALHRLFTGLGFVDAVHDLGARFHDE